MARIKTPTPPSHGRRTHALEQLGLAVGFIWIFDDQGAASIETQYKNAQQMQRALGISRATAYRLIKKHPVRYWCTDLRDEGNPKCYSVLPKKVVDNLTVYPVGNPNFANGIYQQDIARRRMSRRKNR